MADKKYYTISIRIFKSTNYFHKSIHSEKVRMEEREKTHIQTNQLKLLDLIKPNTGLIAAIEQTGILDRGELADLDAILSEYKRTKELLNILKGKINGYTILLNAVSQTKQTGAEAILQQLNKQPSQSNSSGNMANSKYRLVFGNDLNRTQILQSLKPGLVRCLPNRNSNISVIMQLEAMLLFDSDSIDPITNGPYQTEQQRITDLFEVIKGTGDRGILLCLEKLCDLEGLNVASQNIRGTIEKTYPGSVQLRT